MGTLPLPHIIRPRLVDGVLAEAVVTSIRVDRIEVKVYKRIGVFEWALCKVVVKPCTSDWDLNPCSQDSNLAKTHGLPTEITHLVLGLKLRSLMSHRRKNSVRDKVMGKKWVYLERNTLHRQSVGHLRR